MEKIINVLKNKKNYSIPVEIIKEEIEKGSNIIVKGYGERNINLIADAIFGSMENFTATEVENAGYNKSNKRSKDCKETILIYVNSDVGNIHIESITRFSKKGLCTVCICSEGSYHDFREIKRNNIIKSA